MCAHVLRVSPAWGERLGEEWLWGRQVFNFLRHCPAGFQTGWVRIPRPFLQVVCPALGIMATGVSVSWDLTVAFPCRLMVLGGFSRSHCSFMCVL